MAVTHLRTAGVVGVAALIVAACGGGVTGTPVAELWDPCSLPTDVLLDAGADPEPLNATTQRQGENEWKFCTFKLERAMLTVFATTTPFDDVAADARATERQPTSIAGEPAIQFLLPEIYRTPSCFVSAGRPYGTVQYVVSENLMDKTPVSEVCARTREIAGAFLGYSRW
ncbi:DUF3558 family protein [Rhodococcoides corynebacterioides]|uniref:DUF3558 family protein n=1 Tax=Rhodococcoides corynebacterioides TaxID=53972 RepID=A0ABS7P2F4_9NOCA|nr:DUF3558 family protein [Rhodococcus corynebacterioides]MBY6366584.1 DUF3558 family protein [Rhodococcus corynebacterioides]MBY6408047.1 DUF3558 family protein [Rhodococcus corynebacterioides]